MDTYENNYDSENLNKRDENFFDPNQFKTLVRKGKKQSGVKKKLRERDMQKPIWFKIIKKVFEQKTKGGMQKPIWFEINKKEFEELTIDIYNNQDNNDFKIIINKRT